MFFAGENNLKIFFIAWGENPGPSSRISIIWPASSAIVRINILPFTGLYFIEFEMIASIQVENNS